MPCPIRNAEADDAEIVLQLNLEFERFTSPLTAERLEALRAESALYCVAEVDDTVQAFLLAFAEGAHYDSENYRWFSRHTSSFLYIDRLVVAPSAHRVGLGSALYDHALDFARRHGLARLVCEVDAEPPNPVSDAFHQRFGFREVGSQWLGETKRVSLRELQVDYAEPYGRNCQP